MVSVVDDQSWWRTPYESRIGTVLDDRFRIDAQIGEGGMGVVYRATQLSVDRPVAIKVIRDDLGGERAPVRRLLREARLLTTFNHPNIVNVFELGQTPDGAPYLVMEMLRGRTLDAELARTGPFDAQRTCEVAIQLCDALAAAHARGVVHRDLKPQNIMLLDDPAVRDLVKVLDFGIAKSLVAESSATPGDLTEAGAIVGTPRYMAPEALTGERADPLSDLYAVGCIMYELLTGAPPFTDASLSVLLTRQLSERPQPLPVDVPAPLSRVVHALLEKSPERRPATAAGVSAELVAILEGRADPWDLDEAETLDRPGAHPALRPTVRELPRGPSPAPPLPRASLLPVVIAAIAITIASFLISLALL